MKTKKKENFQKRRIIINILDEIKDEKCLGLVLSVIRLGKVSFYKGKPQYCFASKFRNNWIVEARPKANSNTDVFYVYKKKFDKIK